MEELTTKTKLPTWEEIERYNKKDEYKGLELKFHLAESLYLRICVHNESKIFTTPHDDVIYISLCNSTDFPIFYRSYRYCEEAYEQCLVDVWTAATHIQDGLINLKNVLAER